MAKSLWTRLSSIVGRRKYEGASKAKRMRNWKTESGNANAEIYGSLVTLRNRSRDLRRNNPYAARGIQAIATNVVGSGIKTQFRDKNTTVVNNPAENTWKPWAETTSFDFDGKYDIHGFQRAIMEAVSESGEVLVRKRINRKADFPLQYQLLESDFLDTDKTQLNTTNNNQIIQGIEVDSEGRRVAYWLFESHPGAYYDSHTPSNPVSKRVLASEIKHIYRQDRPGQMRGVPWLSPVIVRMKDLDDYEDAQLMRQKIAACFVAFVQDLSADVTDTVTDSDEFDPENLLGSRIEPGQFEFLPSGKTVTFGNPPTVQNYDEYTKNLLRSIAAGLGTTYEILTGDLSNVNFSSARLGWIEFNRNISVWRKDIITVPFLDSVVADFKEMALVLGQDFSRFIAVHTPPRREMIDPVKEIEAAATSIRNGLSTWSEELMAMGKDPEEHFAQFRKDLDMINAFGLKLDSDPTNAPTINQNGNGKNENTQT